MWLREGPSVGLGQTRGRRAGELNAMLPSHIAYVVTDPPGDAPDSRAIWREIGAVWPHKNGHGFDVVIHAQISVSGRIVCTERREREKPATKTE